MKTTIAKISPTKAAIYLKNNNKNRNINEDNVAFLAAQMSKGLWKLNGQSIVIAKSGTLIDGQHRLLAVVSSGVPLETMLCTDVAEDVMATVDTGKPRSAGDVFVINGITSANTVAALSKGIYKWAGSGVTIGGHVGSRKPTNLKILDIYNVDPSGIYWAARQGLRPALRFMRRTECALALYLCRESYGQLAVEEFVDFISDGGDYAKSPSHTLPGFINRRNNSDVWRERGEDCLIFLHCFSKWMANEQLVNIRAKQLMDNVGKFYSTYKLPRRVRATCLS